MASVVFFLQSDFANLHLSILVICIMPSSFPDFEADFEKMYEVIDQALKFWHPETIRPDIVSKVEPKMGKPWRQIVNFE